MDKELFYTYLKDEQQLTKDSLYQLKQIVEEYPYFETAKLMLLKNRQNVNDAEFSSELKKVAITCCDRKKLFYYLSDGKYARFFPKESQKEVDTHDRTEVLLDSFLESLDDGIKEDKEEHPEHVTTTEEHTEWGSNSMVSTDYIAYIEQTQEEKTAFVDEKDSKPMKHQDLVDRFLEKSSNDEDLFSIKNRESEEAEKSAQSVDNLLDDDSFLTETLAHVYIKQKKYEQALAIIKRLSLNFPKKSSYFADQIRFLEYLIYNEKNKK